ncbi:hypothetical protein [Paenibacillus aquistagni]|uniref:hypothetical protein n=1 Tax=Paenibacillus aquistagni TaxID=1852522 RepID=UPI00145B5D2B|nr:hypothetical protein [Paenibacillus aquistagni]NMM52866.1 hypothetical protein [Paenibacillus aquistagni]
MKDRFLLLILKTAILGPFYFLTCYALPWNTEHGMGWDKALLSFIAILIGGFIANPEKEIKFRLTNRKNTLLIIVLLILLPAFAAWSNLSVWRGVLGGVLLLSGIYMYRAAVKRMFAKYNVEDK